ncbi:hypothetical protein AAHE18_20G056300 [Arachis hypogaea]
MLLIRNIINKECSHACKPSVPPHFQLARLGIVADITAYAQDSPQDYLDAHNAARSEAGVADLVWDDDVAAFAENYATERQGDCEMIHSGGGDEGYGENIAWSSGDLAGSEAVGMWVDEKDKYEYDSNSCVGGECRHYTQVVWSNTIRLGCAKVNCDNGGTFITCNYHPPGNYVHQRPY